MSSSNGNNGRKRKSNFDQVPADDGFRNYMKNKIKLQRQQFGLVLPPPPSPNSPQSHSSPTASSAHATPTPTILKRSMHSSGGGHGKIEDSPAKSVRFHSDLDDAAKSKHDAAAAATSSDPKSISDVLNNLNQRHPSTTKRRKRSGRRLSMSSRRKQSDNSQDSEAWTYDTPKKAPTDSEQSTSAALGVLDVLDNLQKKHGSSSRRRRASSSAKKRKHSLESLDKLDSDAPLSIEKNKSTPSLSCCSTTPTSKRKRDSPRCLGASVLEGLQSSGECNAEEVATIQSPNDSTTRTPRKSPATSLSPDVASGRKQKHRPDLFFHGIIVLVNGYTNPDAETIKRLLQKHGGDLEKYETSRVTHIIAEQLSTAKANIYKRQKKPTPVCTPNWIMESVEKQKLLPHADFLLKGVLDKDVFGSKKVKSYFCVKPNQTEEHPGESREVKRKCDDIEGGDSREQLVEDQPEESVTGRPYRWQDKDPHEANHMYAGAKTVGNDPNFLDSYFSNSRLSYIGSFQQRVKSSGSMKDGVPSVRAGCKKFVMLVDMDCFFAAVVLRKYPQHRSKPVAIAHAHSNDQANNANSSSELSTCNYIARQKGVKKGMFLGDAIIKCPGLVVLPYDFEGFQEVSGIVADQLRLYAEQYNGCVEQVSCDEAYVEINIDPNDCQHNDIYDFVKSLAEHVRADIVKKTECTASIGIGSNKLLAKLAADKIKPNGCYVCRDWKVLLGGLDLRDIPGVGRKSQKKLESRALCKVTDVWDLGDEAETVLGEIIGLGNAQKIVKYCFGKDDRPVTPAVRKSIGAECNYGVRFDGPYGVDYMMQGLAKEVETRMSAAEIRGSKLTLKIMKSKDTTKVPGKFLGHGSCHNLSKSSDIPMTRDKDILSSAGTKLLEKLDVNMHSIRGMGLVVTSLKFDGDNEAQSSSPLSTWLKKGKSGTSQTTNNINNEAIDIDQDEIMAESAGVSKMVTFEQETFEITSHRTDSLMPNTFSQIDQDVLQNLPSDILDELKFEYKTSKKPVSEQSPKRPMQRKVAVNKQIPIKGQVSVKRMFKLNSIKSGEESFDGNCSLSQLDCLPLEVQLQIANSDNTTVAKKPSRNTVARQMTTTSIADITTEAIHPDFHYEDVGRVELQEEPRSNLFQDNISPLKDFILSNPDPDVEVVRTVKEFLAVCVSERRLDDVAVFLRAIRNMSCGWNEELYRELRDSVVDEIFAVTGDRLDLDWLGL